MRWINTLRNKLRFILNVSENIVPRHRNSIGYRVPKCKAHKQGVESGSREGKQDRNTVTRSQELHTREHARVTASELQCSCNIVVSVPSFQEPRVKLYCYQEMEKIISREFFG